MCVALALIEQVLRPSGRLQRLPVIVATGRVRPQPHRTDPTHHLEARNDQRRPQTNDLVIRRGGQHAFGPQSLADFPRICADGVKIGGRP